MTFSMSLPSVFKRVIDQNILGVLYEALLGLGMIIEDNILKCNGQCSRLIHVLAILLHFVIEFFNSLTKKGIQIMVVLD